eukprot:gene8963-biopygen7016
MANRRSYANGNRGKTLTALTLTELRVCVIAASHKPVLQFREPADLEAGMTLDTFHFRAMRPAQQRPTWERFLSRANVSTSPCFLDIQTDERDA